MTAVSRVTPMLQQYFEAKARAGNALLLYRMGDFYELFFEDAKLAAPLLGLTLTSRHKDSDIEAPMCGVPHHAVESYIAQLVRHGHRVAVCDQVEDARKAKGLVRREITRIVTPGTVLEPEALPDGGGNYLAALCGAGDEAGIALLDLSTGDFRAGVVPREAVPDLFAAYPIRELLLAEGEEAPAAGPPATILPAEAFSATAAERRLRETFRVASVEALGFAPGEACLGAAWQALDYARENRKRDALHVSAPVPLAARDRLRLDAASLAHLEVFESADPRTKATLFSVLDCCSTPMGSRALREALARPFFAREPIENRLDAVEELVGDGQRRTALREALSGIGDLSRRVARVAMRSAGPRDVSALADSLEALPGIRACLEGLKARALAELVRRLPDLRSAAKAIRAAITEDPPALLTAGGAIRPEVDEELARLSALKGDAHGAMTRFEAREKARTGLSTLKVRYNRVFGYFIEISKSQMDKAPPEYVRRQTLANAERFTNAELTDLEGTILGAEERIAEIEARVFGELLDRLGSDAASLAEAARVLGEADLLASAAEGAVRRRYVRPKISDRARLRVVEGRHPVVEAIPGAAPFVPNDVDLDDSTRIVVLTGPNMGGKSTFLRQTALIALMARAGLFVPASEAEIGPVDRIFTRVGAADHLARGESTFMVEMIEAARILRNATPQSLVILDEVGRGTSTFDGLSLAWAIVEHLHDAEERRAFTLFATHYHEMTELAKTMPGIANFTMAVREWEGRVVFLRKVVAGSADRSYGIHVAELAGIPEPVLTRAREVLANLEEQELDVRGQPRLARREGSEPSDGQYSLFAGQDELVLEKLRETDLDHLTPVAALSLLAALQDRLRR